MSQAGYTPIQLYYSTTAAAVPVNTNLANGELAINITDGKLYYKNNSGVVTLLAGATSGPAGGSNTQVQYNSSGVLAGSANMTFDGTTLTAAGFSGPHNGTVGATTPTTGAFTTGTFSDIGSFGGVTNSSGILNIGSANPLTGVNQNGIRAIITGTSAGTTTVRGVQSQINSAVASYTLDSAQAFYAQAIGKGAGSTITRAIGLHAVPQTVGTNNASISDGITFTGNWFINQTGTDTSTLPGGLVNTPIGATTASTGAFTTLSASSTVTLSGGTANGVTYLNGSKVLTSGSALTWDAANLSVGLSTAPSGSGYGSIVSAGAMLVQGYIGGHQTSVGVLQQNGDVIALRAYGATAGSGKLAFNVGGGGGSSDGEAMRLTSTGLGIGTSSPGARLDVSTGTTNRFRMSEGASALTFDSLNSAATLWSAMSTRATSMSWFTAASGNPTTGMLLDSAGNLGLGVTPSAWRSSRTALQLGNTVSAITGNSQLEIRSNAYLDTSATEIYINSYYANKYIMSAGQHYWYTAPSGTAGTAITFTQRMVLADTGITLSSSSNTTASLILGGLNATNGILQLASSGTAYQILGGDYQGNLNLYTGVGGGPIIFTPANAERGRFASTGEFLVGTTTAAGKLTVANTYTNTSDATIVASATIPGINLRTPSSGRFSIFTSYSANNSTSFVVGTGTSNPSTEAVTIEHTNGTTKFRTAISVGAATPTTSGSGITFPATQDASSDANTLDDYEEGSWTPGFGTGWTTAPTVANAATYVKIGKQVTVSVYLLNGISTAGGLITGLPFQVGLESSMTGFSGTTSTAPLMTGVTQSGTSQIRSIPAATMTSLYWTVSTTYFV
jgi:hypothetical protein